MKTHIFGKIKILVLDDKSNYFPGANAPYLPQMKNPISISTSYSVGVYYNHTGLHSLRQLLTQQVGLSMSKQPASGQAGAIVRPSVRLATSLCFLALSLVSLT